MYPDYHNITRKKFIYILTFSAIILVLTQSALATMDYPSSTSTILSVLTGDTGQYFPGIHQDTVIWLDSSADTRNLHVYNITTGQEIILDSKYIPAEGMFPDVYGHFIAWTSGDYPDYTVILYDRDTSDEIAIAGGNGTIASNPDIGDNFVVWQENRMSILGLYAKDLVAGEETLLASDALNPDQLLNAKISGNNVVWQCLDPDNFTNDIYLFTLGGSNTTLITPHTEDSDEQNPAIDGNFIVYQRTNPETYNSDIYLFNISSGQTLFLTPGTEDTSEEYPDIQNGNVVWVGQDPDTLKYELYLHQIDMNMTFLMKRDMIITDPGLPAIYNNRIVWQQPDPDTGCSDIYLLTYGVEFPQMVANFSADPVTGGVPREVNFTDLSTGNPSGWLWNFGDNTTSQEQNPVHIYNNPGTFGITLITHSPYQRSGKYVHDYVHAGSTPSPAFSFDQNEGIAPLTVKFSDQTNPSPDYYFWNFGDGLSSTDVNPSHKFVNPGSYTVSLTTENEFGNSTTSIENCIVVTSGIMNDMKMNIPGISCDYSHYPQQVTLNTSLVHVQIINNSFIEAYPGAISGIEKIIFISEEGFSWVDQYTLIGPTSHILCESPPLLYSGVRGSNSSVTYQIIETEYPLNGIIHSEVWENATPDDYQRFKEIAILGNLTDSDPDSYSGISGVAFTAQFDCENISGSPSGVLFFALDSDWIEKFGWRWPVPITSDPAGAFVYVDGTCIGTTPLVLPSELSAGNHTVTITRANYRDEVRNITLEEKKDYIRVIRVTEDGAGEILPVTYLYHDTAKNLDYFLAECPQGFSTFGVVSIMKAGNPIQIIFLTLQELLPQLLAGAGGGGGHSSSPPAGGNVPSPTTIVTTSGVPTAIPTITNIVTPISTHTSAETGVATPELTETPNTPPVQTKPGEVFPTIPFTVIQGMGIIFGVILVVSVLLLRWQKGGE